MAKVKTNRWFFTVKESCIKLAAGYWSTEIMADWTCIDMYETWTPLTGSDFLKRRTLHVKAGGVLHMEQIRCQTTRSRAKAPTDSIRSSAGLGWRMADQGTSRRYLGSCDALQVPLSEVQQLHHQLGPTDHHWPGMQLPYVSIILSSSPKWEISSFTILYFFIWLL